MNKFLKFLAGLILAAACLPTFAQSVVRVGAFLSITHAQAMIGKANGWFDKGSGIESKDSMDPHDDRDVVSIFGSECRAY